jgi:hypothetical protein
VIDHRNSGDLSKRGSTYLMYEGNGQMNWPDQSAWLDFESLWNMNVDLIKISCAQFKVPNNSDQEIADIRDSIKKISAETGVDDRFILAIVMQESKGCVRAPTTDWGVRNPGLMQDHNGDATCNDFGVVQTPCPQSTIEQMIRDGAGGTTEGDGLKQTLQQAQGTGAAEFYRAARIYNSGRVADSGDLGDGGATHCYSSDVANRLTGWATDAHRCHLDGPGLPANAPTVPAASAPASQAAPNPVPDPKTEESKPHVPPTENQQPKPYEPPADSQAPKQPVPITQELAGQEADIPELGPVSEEEVNAILAAYESARAPNVPSATGRKAPGPTSDCIQWYSVQTGDVCDVIAQKFSITFARLRELNPDLDQYCSNLWKGYDYCVRVV